MNIKHYSVEELQSLADKIREKILQTVSKNGGHLSSPLGAVDLIVAMHFVFDAKKDPFIFDVSHQAYAHKLLTDRWDKFDTLRQFEGISGFTKPRESEYDYFIAGHSSTSISIATGAAKAIALKKEDRVPVVLIGDGSMSAGMVYEALNELGDRKYPCIIILNDNEMSISKPIGAISNYLSQKMASRFYQKFKAKTEQLLEYLPKSASYMAKRFEESIKLITPGMLFEELGLEYIGPVDGHDIEGLIEVYQIAKELKKPVIIHAQTIKGKGYKIAEGYYEHWHGVKAFDIKTGTPYKKNGVSQKSATELFGNALMKLAESYENVVGVTAAMPSGTGMKPLLEKYPNRFWDVGIAEQHAVTSMAAMAKEGFKPFIAIYSTFLQRAYDQIIHDTCIMKLPVVFAIDRAGIVGEDGETHQGLFDISFLRVIPHITIFAPRSAKSMEYAVEFAYQMKTPCAFRYPRGAFLPMDEFEEIPFERGKSQLLKEGKDKVLFVGFGNGVGKAVEVYKRIRNSTDPAILDLRFVKPLDKEMLKKLSEKYKKWFVFSDSVKKGGVASAVLEFFAQEGISDVKITTFEYEDDFIVQGKTELIERYLKIDPDQIAIEINKNILNSN